MSSRRKKRNHSESRAKQRKQRVGKTGVQLALPVGDDMAHACVAPARPDTFSCEGGPLGDDMAHACVMPADADGTDAGKPAVRAEGPVARRLDSGRALLLVACVCLLLLVLESERAARRLDEFAPDAAAERAAALLRAVGRMSGAARLGEWENSLIRHLAGNTPQERRTTRFSAETGSPGARRDDETVPASEHAAESPEKAAGATAPPPPETAASGTPAASAPRALSADRTNDGRIASDPPASPVDGVAVHDLRTATAPQAAGTLPAPGLLPESAGAPAPTGSALSGTIPVSLPERPGPAEAGDTDKTVLLVGDSTMGWGLGHMLERSMRAYPRISVKRYSRPSTGLCRVTEVDWPKYLGDLVAEHSPDLVVISIGANDGSTMTNPDRRACTVFTPAWEKEYLRRAEEFLRIAGSGGAKVLWVGLPVAGVEKTEKVLRTVSRLQQDACAKYDFADYLDIRAVLADKNGRYTSFRTGDDAAPVRIRAADKVHVSAAGGKLLTDYIMPSVLKILGRAAHAGDVGKGPRAKRGGAVARTVGAAG
jgi:hypothetical protein